MRDALSKYRENKRLVDAYQSHYDSIEDFLTMFPAYRFFNFSALTITFSVFFFSDSSLLESAIEEIAAEIHPDADVRVSVWGAHSLPYYPSVPSLC